jgi:hypothetical protein
VEGTNVLPPVFEFDGIFIVVSESLWTVRIWSAWAQAATAAAHNAAKRRVFMLSLLAAPPEARRAPVSV